MAAASGSKEIRRDFFEIPDYRLLKQKLWKDIFTSTIFITINE